MRIISDSTLALQRCFSAQNITRLPANNSAISRLNYLDLAVDCTPLTDKLIAAMHVPSDREIANTLRALDDILLTAEQAAAESATEISVDDLQLQTSLSDYIFENAVPIDYELCRSLSIISESSSSCSSLTSQSMQNGGWSRLRNILSLAQDDNLCRYFQNTKNIVLRSAICVALPTFLRQLIAYYTEASLESYSASKATRLSLALFSSTVPLLLNFIGGLRDYFHGTANVVTQSSRAFNMLVCSGALIAAATTDVLPGIASTLVSFLFYSLLREGTQTLVRLSSEAKIGVTQTLLAAGLYIPNQVAVSFTMSQTASPSGAASAAQHCIYGDTVVNDLLRAGINTAGELADSLVFRGLNALHSEIPLRNRLEISWPESELPGDVMFNSIAARTALMTTPLMASAALQTALAQYFDEQTLEQIDDAFNAVLLGMIYPSFVAAITGYPAPSITDSKC